MVLADTGNLGRHNEFHAHDSLKDQDSKPEHIQARIAITKQVSGDEVSTLGLDTIDGQNKAIEAGRNIYYDAEKDAFFESICVGDPKPLVVRRNKNDDDEEGYGAGVPFPDYIKAQFGMVTEVNHVTRVQAKFLVRWTPTTKNAKTVNNVGTIDFTMANMIKLPTVGVLRANSSDEAKLQAAASFGVDRQELEAWFLQLGDLFLVQLQFKGSEKFIGSSIVADHMNHGPFADEMANLKRFMTSGQDVTFRFLLSTPEFVTRFRSCIASLTDTRPVANGRSSHDAYANLFQWFEQPRVNPQEGQVNMSAIIAAASYDITWKVASRPNYVDANEFFTVNAVGLQAEKFLAGSGQMMFTDLKVRFLEMPNTKDVYFAMFEYHQIENMGEYTVRFSPGDSIQICLNLIENDREHDWHGTVTENPPYTFPGDFCAVVTRPLIKEDEDDNVNARRDDLRLTAEAIIKFDQQGDMDEVCKQLGKMPGINAKIAKQNNTKSIQRQITANFNGYVEFNKGDSDTVEWIDNFLGNTPSSLPTHCMFEELFAQGLTKQDLLAVCDQISSEMGLNTEQHAALLSTTESFPGRIRCIDGPAGTGKTYFLAALYRVFDALKLRGFALKTIFATTTNGLVDYTARSLREHCAVQNGNTAPQQQTIIVRQHTHKTEKAAAKIDATLSRTEVLGAPDNALQFPSYDNHTDILEELAVAADLKTRLENHLGHVVPGIKDKRLTDRAWSVGELIYRVTGADGNVVAKDDGANDIDDIMTELRTNHPLMEGRDEPLCFSNVRTGMRKWASGTEMSPDDRANFTMAINRSMDYIFTHIIDHVVTTTNNALTSHCNGHAPTLLIIDEASRITDAECLAMITQNKPLMIFAVGDYHQMLPFTQLRQEKFCLSGLYGKSILTRSMLCGFTTIYFREEMRFSKDICDLVNSITYNDLVPSRDADNRPSTRYAKALFKRLKVPDNRTVAWFVSENSNAARHNQVGNSTSNAGNVETTMYLLLQMFKGGAKPSSFAIIVPYTAQYYLYMEAFKKLGTLLRNSGLHDAANGLADLHVATCDSYQGMEASIIIFDVVVDRKLGFVKQSQRFTTTLTRAKDALMIIGNPDMLKNEYGFNKRRNEFAGTKIKSTIAWTEKQKVVIRADQGSPWSLPEMKTTLSQREALRRDGRLEGFTLGLPPTLATQLSDKFASLQAGVKKQLVVRVPQFASPLAGPFKAVLAMLGVMPANLDEATSTGPTRELSSRMAVRSALYVDECEPEPTTEDEYAPFDDYAGEDPEYMSAPAEDVHDNIWGNEGDFSQEQPSDTVPASPADADNVYMAQNHERETPTAHTPPQNPEFDNVADNASGDLPSFMGTDAADDIWAESKPAVAMEPENESDSNAKDDGQGWDDNAKDDGQGWDDAEAESKPVEGSWK